MAGSSCRYCGSKSFVQQRPHPTISGGVPTCSGCDAKIADMNRNRSFPTSGVDSLATGFPLQEQVDAYQQKQRSDMEAATRKALADGQQPFIPVDRGNHPNRKVDPRK